VRKTLATEEVARLERQIEQALRTLSMERDSLDSRDMRELRLQLQAAMRMLETTRLQVEAAAALEAEVALRARERTDVLVRRRESEGHPGWLGVWLSTSARVVGREGGHRLWRFNSYPIVSAVDPASPASRAGLRADDVLLSFDGKDLRAGPLPLDQLITPGHRLQVRVRRDGAVRALTLTVAPRPERESWEALAAPPAPLTATPRAPRTPVPAIAPAPLPPESPPGFVWISPPRAATFTLAGAEMARMNADLAETFAVEGGVLVLRVLPGTPAARAGLRGGDVIVGAGGEEVEAPQELRDAMVAVGERGALALDVVRKGGKTRVKLTW
jgi:serine protease Do